MSCLGERVELDPFAVGDGCCNIGLAVALQDGAEQGITLIVDSLKRDVARGNLVFVAGRKEEIFAALALVGAGGADVGDGGLPAVVDGASDGAAFGWRDL